MPSWSIGKKAEARAMDKDMKTHAVREFHVNHDEADRFAEEIRNIGFTVVESGFSADELQLIRQKIDDIYEQQVREMGSEDVIKRINDADLVRCIIGYDDYFLTLATHPLIMAVTRKLLGENFILMAQNAIINRPRDDEMERYYSDILEATSVACVLSTHQSVGYFIPAELIGRLVDRYQQVIGVNVSGPDMSYLQRVIDTVAGRADVHVGGPMHALTCLALGGQGYLSSEGNLAPNLCVSIIDRYLAGDLTGCFEAYNRLMHLFTATRDMGGITGTKAALQLLGLPGGSMRRPRLALPESLWHEVRQTMIDDIDLKEIEGL